MWSCSPKLKEDDLLYDVIFRFQNSSFSCKKFIFANASSYFKRMFDSIETSKHHEDSLETSKTFCLIAGAIVVDIEDSSEAFEAIHSYVHYPDSDVNLYLLPTVCKIAKKYQFHDAWRTFGNVLAESISFENIGEVCPLVALAYDQTDAAPSTEDATSLKLTMAVRSFLIANADVIASSQTGQLSARLFIDVLEGPHSPFIEPTDEGFPNSIDDWSLSERVLLYCSHRVQDEEPLDEGNYFVSDGNAARKLTNSIYACASDTVTDEIRMTIPDTQLVNLDKTPPSQLSLSGGQTPFSEVPRQMGNEGETAIQVPSIQSSSRLTSPTDQETCLVAATSLGAGTISIHLGKLEGRLVSVSVKRRRTPSGPGSSTSSSTVGGCGVPCPTPLSLPTSIILPLSPPPVNNSGFISSRSSLHDDHYLNECCPCGCTCQKTSILRSFGCLSTPLLEARSTAGACTIGSAIEDKEDEAGAMVSHLVLVAGGTSHGRCLNSTEILRISRPIGEADSSTSRRVSMISANSDSENFSNGSVSLTTQPGPEMRSPRGRLALAALKRASCIYTFGGCDGNDDLATAERLSFDVMDEHYKKWDFISSMQQKRSCCAVAAWADESVFAVVGGQCEGSPLSSVEAYYPDSNRWLSLPSMSEARSQLCAVTLSQRNLIVAVGGVSETPSTPSTQPSNSLNSNAFESVDLSPSGEAYDPRCSHWIRLPELLNRGPLIGAALVSLSPSSGRLLLIGGSDGLSTMTQTQIFDSRAWSWLQGPSLIVGRASPCAVSLASPSIHSTVGMTPNLPCIVVIGGYNLAAGGFLNSVEIVGVTSSSGYTSPLNMSFNTSPRMSNFPLLPNDSAEASTTPPLYVYSS